MSKIKTGVYNTSQSEQAKIEKNNLIKKEQDEKEGIVYKKKEFNQVFKILDFLGVMIIFGGIGTAIVCVVMIAIVQPFEIKHPILFVVMTFFANAGFVYIFFKKVIDQEIKYILLIVFYLFSLIIICSVSFRNESDYFNFRDKAVKKDETSYERYIRQKAEKELRKERKERAERAERLLIEAEKLKLRKENRKEMNR